MKIFLIDFENVKSKGLTGIDQLEADDTVIIMYSENSDTISFEMHRKVMTCKADIEYFKVHVGGKNALDFQLSSLLGYIVARGEHSHIFIISNDRGFDFLHDFWHGDFVADVRSVVYRTRTIAQGLCYAQGAGQPRFEEIEEPAESVQEEIIEEDIFEPVESIIEEQAESSEEAAAAAENELSDAVTEEVEASAPVEEPIPMPPKAKLKRPKGYMPNLTNILHEVCTPEQIQQISELLSESETKEELHNSLAKIYKQQATDFYKLIRPRYLRLKQLYLKENPEAAETAAPENTDSAPAEEPIPEQDKLTALIHEYTDEEYASETERIKKCALAANTKQQFYIRMVKEFGKDVGCKIYKGMKSKCEELLEAAKEIKE